MLSWMTTFATTPTWPSNWLLNNLSAYYKCDTNGSFPDAHWSNNWTINGATFTASGQINWAYDYDWTNDYISVPDSTDLDLWVGWGDFSFSFWINPDVAPSNWTKNRMLFAKTPWWWDDAYYLNWRYIDASNNALRLLISSNWTTSETLDVNVAISLSTWTHIVWIFDASASTWTVYKDNVSQWTATWTITSLHNSAWALNIWQINSGTLQYDWKLDEIWIWKTLLDSTNVSDLYNSWSWLSYDSFTS